jgi:Tfp pilus assembly protein PilF
MKESILIKSGGAMGSLRSVNLLALSLLFLVSCASKNQSEIKSKPAAIYFGAGTQSLMDQQYTDALTSLMKANELEPGNSEILNNLGMAYYFKGENDLALQHLKESLKINPQNSDTRVNLASITYHLGDYASAEKLYLEVLKDLTYDKQARTLYNLGLLELTQKKNVMAAENYFKKSLKEDPNYCPAYFQVGLIQYNNRQFNTALRNFKDASMGTCYDAPQAHYYQALTLTELRKFTDARLKYDEIETRFKKSTYAAKARLKTQELNALEQRYRATEAQASGKMLTSPEF